MSNADSQQLWFIDVVTELCRLIADLEDEKTDKEEEKEETESEVTEEEEKVCDIDQVPIETPYVENTHEELGQVSVYACNFDIKAIRSHTFMCQ